MRLLGVRTPKYERPTVLSIDFIGSGGRTRTDDLGVMNPISAAAYNAFQGNKQPISAGRQSFEQKIMHDSAYSAQKITPTLQQISSFGDWR